MPQACSGTCTRVEAFPKVSLRTKTHHFSDRERGRYFADSPSWSSANASSQILRPAPAIFHRFEFPRRFSSPLDDLYSLPLLYELPKCAKCVTKWTFRDIFGFREAGQALAIEKTWLRPLSPISLNQNWLAYFDLNRCKLWISKERKLMCHVSLSRLQISNRKYNKLFVKRQMLSCQSYRFTS